MADLWLIEEKPAAFPLKNNRLARIFHERIATRGGPSFASGAFIIQPCSHCAPASAPA